ncbi:MAG: hypothetical protein WBB69_13430 [Anaerolineales bacterium]
MRKKSILFFIVLMLLTGLACSAVQSLQRFSGVDGEVQDANHEQWTDLLEDEPSADEQPAPEPDTGAEASESSTAGGAQENHALDASLENTALSYQIESGDVTLELIDIIDGDTQGEIIEISVTNQSGEELVFEIPAGLVFSPDETNEQDLMVLDAVVVDLEPGETIVLTPYVVCIDASAATPSTGSEYQLGYLESGDLLAFAQCVDEEADGTLDQEDLGLQFAVWSIVSSGNVMETPELPEVEGGALSGLMEELEAIPGMGDTLDEMILVFGQEWLQRCGISIEGEQ